MALVTRNLTILLTDIKGFTDKSSQKTRAEIQHMLDEHKQIVLPILQSKGGKLVKTIGDAFLMTFESPTDAVLAGTQVQEALRLYNAGKEPDQRIEIRVAINQGEVNLSDNDVFGEPVNITARIEAIAEANEVFFTDAVYLAMNKKEVPSSEVGLLQLKGIPEKVRVYKVKREIPVDERSAANGAIAAAHGSRERGPRAAAAALEPPAPLPAKTATPSALRRCGAILIDACLCAILVSNFWPGGDRTQMHVKMSRRALESSWAACGPDIRRVCGGVRRGGGRIVMCLRAHQAELSTPCQARLLAARQDVRVNVGLGGVEVEDADGKDEPAVDLGEGWSVRMVNDRRHVGFAVVWLLYSTLMLKWMGTTPGGRVLKLAIVSVEGSGPVDKKQRWLRGLFSLISAYCAGLGYLWALWERDGRGWHDLIAGTRVVAAE